MPLETIGIGPELRTSTSINSGGQNSQFRQLGLRDELAKETDTTDAADAEVFPLLARNHTD